MPTPQENLKDLLERISSTDVINISIIVHLMVLTREILEDKKNWKAKYPLLNFYCNWCLHPNLSKTARRYKIFKEIVDVFAEEFHTTNINKIIKRISEIMSFEKLRHEFIKVYENEEIKLQSFLFRNPENWQKVVSILISILRDKPIEINPEGPRGKKLLDYIQKKTAPEIYLEPQTFRLCGEIIREETQAQSLPSPRWEIDVLTATKVKSNTIIGRLDFSSEEVV